jgi:glutamyl-tRNA reductase
MSLVVVGTNHKYSPIGIREKLSFSKGKAKDALINLAGFKWVKAGVILSTCNRVELYAITHDIEIGIQTLKTFLADYHRQDLFSIEPYLYTHIDKETISHLFNVAAGLDSQIVGETQILEQVRFAFEEAKKVCCMDAIMDNAFSSALRAGKSVREQTNISKGNTSIGNIAISLIKARIESLSDKKVLIIGVGKVSELLAGYLKKEGALAIFVSNRTFLKAKELAESLGAVAIKFDQLKEKLKEVDVVISATKSPHFILRNADILEAHRPLLIIDLALPRDVEPEVRYINGIELYCLDDLSYIIENNLDKRKDEVYKAGEFIKKEAENTWILIESLELAAEPAFLP